MLKADDARFLATLKESAPRFVSRIRYGKLKAWLAINWPLPFVIVAAAWCATLAVGYTSPTWPFYIATSFMIWWSGRVAGGIVIVCAALLEVNYLPWERWSIMVVTLSTMLILRGRRGLGTCRPGPVGSAPR